MQLPSWQHWGQVRRVGGQVWREADRRPRQGGDGPQEGALL